MRGDALLDAMEGIDACYIEEAAALPKKRAAVWLRVLSVAACVCLVFGAVGGVAWWRTVPRSPMDNTLIGVPENGKAPSAFGSLDELIAARADGESHPNRADSFLLSASVQTTVDQMIELQQAVVHESVAYHVSEDGVQMSVLSESPLVSSLVLQGDFDGLLYTGQHLITVQSLDEPTEKPLSTVYATKVTVYAFGSSHNLLQVHEWTQAANCPRCFCTGVSWC